MPLISLTGCQTCSLRREWPKLATPQMSTLRPKQQSPYKILVLGENPSDIEDRLGLQFADRAGSLLRECLPRNWEEKLYYQFMVRCKPPSGRAPSVQEINCCTNHLEKDLREIEPDAILGVGDLPTKYFWPGTSVFHIRGVPFPVQSSKTRTCWYYPIFDPYYVAHQERKDEDGQMVNYALPVFRNDIRKFFELLPNLPANPRLWRKEEAVATIVYPRTIEEARQLFARLKQPWAMDVETFKLKPYMRDNRLLTAAFSDGDLTFAFPIQWPGHMNGWGMQAFIEFMTSKQEWIAQGTAFELAWVWYHTKQVPENFHDTEILARLKHERKGINGLDSISRVYLGADIKEWSPIASKNQLHLDYPLDVVLQYNGVDAWSTAKIFPILLDKLSKEDLENYRRILPTLVSTVGMELAGLPVDLKASERMEQKLKSEEKEIEQKARELPEIKKYEREEKKTLALSSPPMLGHIFTKYCGLKLEPTKNGSYVTEEEALLPYLESCKLVEHTLDWRELDKLLSTYVLPIISGEIIGVDGLIHPTYKVVHTATYRLSSEYPNIQNFPKRKHKEIRVQIIAMDGYILVAFDFGQLEARVFCIAARDKVLRQAFIDKVDIHSKWRDRILKLYPPYWDRLVAKSGQTDEQKVLKAGRDTIKTDFVFASFYGSRARSVAQRAMLPESIAFKVLGEFWEEYSESKRWLEDQFASYARTGTASSLTGRVRGEVLPGNEVINTPIQGTAAEIVLEAQNFLFNYAITTKQYEYMPRVNIHDDLIFMLKDDDKLMEKIDFIGNAIVAPRFPFITVPMNTECRVGYNWAELYEVNKFEGAYYAL